MTEEEAKEIINEPGYPDVTKTIEAIHVAEEALGDDATMSEIFKWASGKNEKDV